MDNIVTSMLFATIIAGTPLIITALGELVTEKSGVLNLGAEGIMSVGADRGVRRRARFGKHVGGRRRRLHRRRRDELHLRHPDADADGESGRVGACAVDLRRRVVGVHRQAVRVGDDARSAVDPHSVARRHPGDRARAVRPAVARLFVVAAVRRRRHGSSTSRAPGSCCAPSASRRPPHTRSVIR